MLVIVAKIAEHTIKTGGKESLKCSKDQKEKHCIRRIFVPTDNAGSSLL